MDDPGSPVEQGDPGNSEPAEPAAPSERGTRRPRPYAGARVGSDAPDEKPAAPQRRDPIGEFFARTDEEDERGWFRRRKKRDAEPDSAPEPKAKKPATGRHSDSSPRSARVDLSRYVRRLVKLAIIIGVAIVAALLLRSYVVAPYYVPSQSMEPTLHGCPTCNDDHVLVEKLSYHFHAPQPGDIVVFNRPPNWHVTDKVLIKRVIGVAGDRITLKHGHVFRNGQRLDEPYVNAQCKQGTTTENGTTRLHHYPRVKRGEVFVMGDNRCDSADSRFFGDVPTSDIIGRAFMIVWPVHRIHTLK